MIAEFLSPNDPRWGGFLERAPHDAYHLPEYCCAAGHYEHGDPIAYYTDQGGQSLLMPLLVRELPAALGAPAEWRDASSPYGYSGPIATPDAPIESLRCAVLALRELAQERDIVSAFIRLHPFRSVPVTVLAEVGTVVTHAPVTYVDLTKSYEDWWAETRSDHRRNITRLTRLGYSVSIDDWTAYPGFRDVYQTTMRRRSANPFYYFSDEYFDELRELLGSRLHLCTVHAPAGDVAAAGLFMVADGIAEYHLGGTADEYFALAPSKLMLDYFRRWAKELGCSLLNLGGGIGGSSDSLQRFKSGFSRSQADFHTVRIVFDKDRYEQLTNASRGSSGSDDAANGFFPAYRSLDRMDAETDERPA